MPVPTATVAPAVDDRAWTPARRAAAAAALAALLLLAAVLFIRAGLMGAYLAADDFQWLAGGRRFDSARILDIAARGHFYRPAIDIWFALTSAGCGFSAGCFHFANLIVHVMNVGLVFTLALALFKDLRTAFLGALVFALEPGYTQAVVWVSAITGLLATFSILSSLLAQVASWSAPDGPRRFAWEILAVALAFLAVFSHEAGITLPVLSVVMWWQFGPRGRRPGLILMGGFALATAAFATTAIIANRRNYVFTESHYTIGLHAIRHGLDYFVALYVGPGWWLAYLGCIVGIALLLAATPRTRFGAIWLLVTVVPYLGFTWGNVSRYLYLPSIGFAIALAAAVVSAGDALSVRYRAARRPIQAGGFVVAAFIVLRFLRFDNASIRTEIQLLEPWRAYAMAVLATAPAANANVVHLPPPKDPQIETGYLEPMARWIYRNDDVTVVVDR